MEIRKLVHEDAHAAALLHIEGQPGTFLTDLGEEFLTVFYRDLAVSKWSFGFIAWDQGRPMGVIAGTSDTHGLFREFVLRRGLDLAIPVLRRLLQKPALLWGVIQTLLYPRKLHSRHGDAEFLFIGVRSEARRHGIGSKMLEVLIEECRHRGATALISTVDVTNPRANAFHIHRGFKVVGSFDLYGREMHLYSLDLAQAKPAA